MENLPVEVLTIILLLSMNSSQRKSRRRLSLVCRTWNTIISQYPLFWTEVGLHRSAKEVSEVLRRNTVGPLDVSWTPPNSRKPVGDTAKKLMEQVSAESWRWRSLTLKGCLSGCIQTHLVQVPTPRLINFNICHIKHHFGTTPNIRLTPGGLPLRNVVLGYVTLDWDCSRLKGLRSLRIQGFQYNRPSLLQLHKIISSSPELEILALMFCDGDSWGSADPLPSLDIITLDSLNTLILDSREPNIVGGISSSIIAPNCNNLKIHWASANVAQDPYAASRLADLLRGSLKRASTFFLSYEQLRGDLILRQEGDEQQHGSFDIREATSKLAKRHGLYFHISFANAVGFKEPRSWNDLLRTVIGKVLQPALSGLKIPVQFQLSEPPSFPPPGTEPQEFALDNFFDLTFINSLELFNLSRIISIIDYLASPQPCPSPGADGDNRPRAWPCPNLEKITVFWGGEDRQDLKDALDRLRSNRAACHIKDQSDDLQGCLVEKYHPCPIKNMTISAFEGDSYHMWTEKGWILLEVNRLMDDLDQLTA